MTTILIVNLDLNQQPILAISDYQGNIPNEHDVYKYEGNYYVVRRRCFEYRDKLLYIYIYLHNQKLKRF